MKKIRLNTSQMLHAYVAFECLPVNTPVFLNADGDIAHIDADGSWSDVPKNATFIGLACPNNIQASTFKVNQDKDGSWFVEGYGNRFDTRISAFEFALNTVGLEADDLDSVKAYIASHINTEVMAA